MGVPVFTNLEPLRLTEESFARSTRRLVEPFED
jgi:hypothetical protein